MKGIRIDATAKRITAPPTSAADAEPHIGVAQRPELDQHEQGTNSPTRMTKSGGANGWRGSVEAASMGQSERRAQDKLLVEDDMEKCARWISIASLSLLAAPAVVTALAQADSYPDRTVMVITDAAAGSTPDVDARLVADGLSKSWGQQVIVLDRPGANGSIGARAAAEAAPDGYTLYMPALSTFVAQQGVAPNIPLEVPRDFVPIGFVAENPMFIAVGPSLNVKTLPELIALAKKRPGKISYAVTGVGRLTHLTGELLQMRAGINLLMVPYTAGPAHALGDVMGGRVDLIIEGYSGIAGAIRAGQVKPIAVASAQRLPDFPNLPTVAEAIPGFSATGWQIVVAPIGTPETIVRRVSDDLRQVVDDPEFKKKLGKLGSYSRSMSPGEATSFVQAEQQKWKSVLTRIAAGTQ